MPRLRKANEELAAFESAIAEPALNQPQINALRLAILSTCLLGHLIKINDVMGDIADALIEQTNTFKSSSPMSVRM